MSGEILGIIDQDPSVSKSDQLHVDIFQIFFISLGYILCIILKHLLHKRAIRGNQMLAQIILLCTNTCNSQSRFTYELTVMINMRRNLVHFNHPL